MVFFNNTDLGFSPSQPQGRYLAGVVQDRIRLQLEIGWVSYMSISPSFLHLRLHLHLHRLRLRHLHLHLAKPLVYLCKMKATLLFSLLLSIQVLPAIAATAYWLETIKHQGISAFNSDPATYQVFRNVKSFGAKGQPRIPSKRVSPFPSDSYQAMALQMILQPFKARSAPAHDVHLGNASPRRRLPPWYTSPPEHT
jgi:hypothetical protein